LFITVNWSLSTSSPLTQRLQTVANGVQGGIVECVGHLCLRRRAKVARHTSHVTHHSSSLRRPDAAQIRHDVGFLVLDGGLQGSALAAAQGVRSTRIRSAREVRSSGRPQYSEPYFSIIERGITDCSWRSRLRRSSAEYRRYRHCRYERRREGVCRRCRRGEK
jgi:hypothetical protein